MSNSVPTSPETIIPQTSHRESAQDFLIWALTQLELEFHQQNNIFSIQLAETDRDQFGGKAILKLALDKNANEPHDETFSWDGTFYSWLADRLSAEKSLLSLCPADQPHAVRDISERIFSAYTVDDGQVHLRGCHLTDFPFLRLSFPANDDGILSLHHIFVAHDGSTVSDALAEKLGLENLDYLEKFPHRLEEEKLNTLIASGRNAAAKLTSERDPDAKTIEPVIISVLWIKHADGLLEFTIGDSMETLPFSGWAKLVQAPAFVAKNSGQSTFHLAITDDGRMDAAEQIEICQQSGKRVLKQDLITCNVTGKRVLEEYVRTCPVLGLPALSDEYAVCRNCQQSVSNAAISDGVCMACLSMTKLRKDDPRLVWIFGEHEALEKWSRWKLSETAEVYIAEASSLINRLLLVFDKETLDVRHMATSNRLSSSWTPLPESEAEKYL